jgi:hypothetical protein
MLAAAVTRAAAALALPRGLAGRDVAVRLAAGSAGTTVAGAEARLAVAALPAGARAMPVAESAALRRALVHREFGNRSGDGRVVLGARQRGADQLPMRRPEIVMPVLLVRRTSGRGRVFVGATGGQRSSRLIALIALIDLIAGVSRSRYRARLHELTGTGVGSRGRLRR